jgi:hypothetical protein
MNKWVYAEGMRWIKLRYDLACILSYNEIHGLELMRGFLVRGGKIVFL